MFKSLLFIILASLITISAFAETPIYPTRGVYSPNTLYSKTASWNIAKSPKGYLVTISTQMKFNSAVSDWVTCTLPGMTGVAGNETVRFSIGFSEIKTITFVGFVPSTSVQLICLTEGSKLAPEKLEAAMVAISADQMVKISK